MNAANFNWFLHTMLFVHTQYNIKKRILENNLVEEEHGIESGSEESQDDSEENRDEEENEDEENEENEERDTEKSSDKNNSFSNSSSKDSSRSTLDDSKFSAKKKKIWVCYEYIYIFFWI